MSDECEHLQVRTEGNLQAGTCRCECCGKIMALSEGYNCLLDAMRKRITEMDSVLEQERTKKEMIRKMGEKVSQGIELDLLRRA